MSWTVKESGYQEFRKRIAVLVETIYDCDTDITLSQKEEIRESVSTELACVLYVVQTLGLIRPEDRKSLIYMVNQTSDFYGYPVKKDTYVKRIMNTLDACFRRSENKETPQAGERGGEPVRSEERH